MNYIDEKFKDAKPADTVAKIKGILEKIGIETIETWHESGVDNCFSLSLCAKGGVPYANGKGITRELAKASAYGEFIERLQGGLFFYKYQSIIRNPNFRLHAYAPDAKYMSAEEFEQNSEWMDYIVKEYNNPAITRKSITKHCQIFSCADGDKILTVPFYSLFEKKYVYLPIDFVDQVYATNGCCVGNTKYEAWVHALSEMIERHCALKVLLSGKSAPKFSPETIEKFPVVSNIINQIRSSGEIEVDIFDYSLGCGFPVVSTRIIDKKTHSYRVNVAADPVLEIAIQRSLTEMFQGKNLSTLTKSHNGRILNKVDDFSISSNILNQLETGSGLYTADYFLDIDCNESCESDFADNSNKTNKQLLEFALDIFKKENKPVYVRNFSYLGFNCYRFVVPGYSEAFIPPLFETVPEYSIADMVCKSFRNPSDASDSELNLLITYSKMIKNKFGRYNSFGRISGVPLSKKPNSFLAYITRAHAFFKLKQYDNAILQTKAAMSFAENDKDADYFACINKYIELVKSGITNDKINLIINKFFTKSTADRLFDNLKNKSTPYGEFLLSCDYKNCDKCNYKEYCCYHSCESICKTAGAVYSKFANGQDVAEFNIDK